LINADTGDSFMSEINVYKQYFSAECEYNGRSRHAAQVLLTAASEGGIIRYEVRVSFFPHDDPEDFAVSYDAESAELLYEAKGRRSRKREQAYLEEIRTAADRLAEALGGVIYWDKPLIDARYG
jgi:hypothetical protein